MFSVAMWSALCGVKNLAQTHFLLLWRKYPNTFALNYKRRLHSIERVLCGTAVHFHASNGSRQALRCCRIHHSCGVFASYSYALLPAEPLSNFGFQLFQKRQKRRERNKKKTETNFNHGHKQTHAAFRKRKRNESIIVRVKLPFMFLQKRITKFWDFVKYLE